MASTKGQVRARRDLLSDKASALSRTLSLSGIAATWLFAEKVGSQFRIDKVSLWALAFFCLSLLSDMIHYALGTAQLSLFATRMKKEREELPGCFQFTVYAGWVLKVGFATIGALLLIWGIWERITTELPPVAPPGRPYF